MGNFEAGGAAATPHGVPHSRVRFKTRGASLGLRATAAPELVRRVEIGLPFKALESFASQTGLAISAIAPVLGIPERTLARRKAAGKLAPDESERLLRLSLIFEKAVALFEGRVAPAMAWLTRPNRALGGEAPFEYSRVEVGAREVENLIGRLEYGVFS